MNTAIKLALRPVALAAAASWLLAGCSAVPDVAEPVAVGASPWAVKSSQPLASPAGRTRWRHLAFPGKTPTQFHYSFLDGRDAMAASAVSSASMLRTNVRVEPAELGRIRFSWKVPQLITGADLAARDADDSPVRVMLIFEGDRSRFSSRDVLLSELLRTLTGEEMPYATLMYGWCSQGERGRLIANPRTARVRTLAMESGPGRLNQWLDYERDIEADYRRAFGEKPGALVGIGIMTDSDNTRSSARAWYGPVRLAPRAAPVSAH